MHTLYGVLFVAASTLIACFYLICLVFCGGFLFQALVWLKNEVLSNNSILQNDTEKPDEEFYSFFSSFELRVYTFVSTGFNRSKQYILKLFEYKWVFLFGSLFLVSLINANVYFQLRGKWVRDEITHKDAREYFVAGQVVNSFRLILIRFVHPDHILLSPFHYLQHHIYNRGVQYLPEKDGEEGVWMDLWFVNIYAHRFYLTQDEKNSGHLPYNMIRLIDLSWFSIEKCMTQPFSDKTMFEVHCLRRIPRMLFYYSLYKNYSVGTIYGSHRYALSDEVLNRRVRQIEAWTDQIRDEWSGSDYIKTNLIKNPKVAATLDVVQLLQLRGILFKQIRDGVFHCSDPYIVKYKNLLSNMVLDTESSLSKIKNATQRRRLFSLVMKTHASEFVDDYLLHDYCGYSVSQTILNINDESYKKLYSNYYEEMDILKKLKGESSQSQE
ncbi:hypothetical protein [Desulfoluna spongiiphila]|uniref:hypothetical protein n=1 Tax=Desulfoluna spongiiphila TaxID=419481 RepID=UPI001259F7D9|nr:hypothetical protein [Desulfoluna spongiiphila]VVS95039.1 hypothetical protein DBB_46160 [Desulfoluna spongiiphila]